MRSLILVLGSLGVAAAAYFAVDAISVGIPGTQKARVRALVQREQAFNARPKPGEPATTRKIVDDVDLGVDWFTVCAGSAAAGLTGGLALVAFGASRREKLFAVAILSLGIAALLAGGGREPWSASVFGVLFVWLGFSVFGPRRRVGVP
jgi:hypothetical protein